MHAAVTDAAAAAAARRARARRLAGLYALTPDELDTPRLVAAVGAALDGGARAIQYRNKAAPPDVRRAQAQPLARLVAARGALFIVNDDAALAAAVGADGVHVGEDDGSVAAARAIVGEGALIGVSCYDDPARADAAVRDGADYVAFGSFFPSSTKPGARRATVGLLRQARRLGVPVVAIGGIDARNARALVEAGADALAVIRDVFERPTPQAIAAAAAAIAAVFSATTSSPP